MMILFSLSLPILFALGHCFCSKAQEAKYGARNEAELVGTEYLDVCIAQPPVTDL